MKGLFQSRKFWILIANITISNAIYWATNFLAPEISAHVLWLIGSWQPAVIALITGIAIEDAANVKAFAVSDAAEATVKVAKIKAAAVAPEAPLTASVNVIPVFAGTPEIPDIGG